MLDGSVLSANGRTLAKNGGTADTKDADVIRPLTNPLKSSAGLTVLSGNLFDSAVMQSNTSASPRHAGCRGTATDEWGPCHSAR